MEDRYINNLDLSTEFQEFEDLCVISFGEGTNPHKEMYDWLFDENPYNPPDGNMMYVMRDKSNNNLMMAADGLIPCELFINGKTYKTAHSVKSMTHPDYKGQGIFRIMTDNSLNQAKAHGVDIVLGLANDNSYPAYQKFGWTTLFTREVYVFPANITNKLHNTVKIRPIASLGNAVFQGLMKLKLKSGGRIDLKKSGFSVSEHDVIPEEVETCWQEQKDKFCCLLVRDYKYLKFRYDGKPDANYKTLLIKKEGKPIGYVVMHQSLANGKEMISVTEAFTDPESTEFISALASAIIDYCYDKKVDYAVICTGHFGKFKDVFLKHGFVSQGRGGTVMIAKSLNPEISEESLVGHDKWHITQGDGESELDL